jgi:hypothetical protein
MTEATTVPSKAEPRRFAVRNFIDEAQLKIDLAYSLADLSSAMHNQAGFTIHYATLAAKASRQVDDIELLIAATESTIYRTIRDAAIASDDKLTEPRLAKQVAGSPQVIALRRALNEAKQIKAVAAGAVQAFRHRKDMLVQEGAATRVEMQGDLRMREISSHSEALAQQRERVAERLTNNKQ